MAGRAEIEQSAMQQAILEGWKAAGISTPNPPVGCVILDDSGKIVGRGATEAAGGAHAEVNALAQAGSKARGGTAVVTLEPCAHVGKTPPCSVAIIRAGVKRVVFAVAEPNPIAQGGATSLRERGIEAEAGLLETEARGGSLEPWLHVMKNGRPFVSLKYAATLDGKIAASDGSSKWVTSGAARADVQLWRTRSDAIMIGTGTALSDNPRLTVRDPEGNLGKRQLLRVVVGEREIPASFSLHDASAKTLFVHERDPGQVLEQLSEHSVQHVYLEGGHTLAAAFMRVGLVDRVFIYIAPKLLGDGLPAMGGLGISQIMKAQRLDIRDVSTIVDGWETDIRLIGYPINET
jgi:diaminohydroxyphosphoribosylaminopyrimidine deaminase/5-amino-6-(5-phosphoribosylamino)uracil reductase